MQLWPFAGTPDTGTAAQWLALGQALMPPKAPEQREQPKMPKGFLAELARKHDPTVKV